MACLIAIILVNLEIKGLFKSEILDLNYGDVEMNINRTLFDVSYTSLENYFVDKDEVEDLLFNIDSRDIRQKKAYGIVEKAMSYRGKPDLFKGLVDLAKVEMGIGELQPNQRDHVVHSVLTFILGVYMINKIPKLNRIEPFEWSLASFFHDVAYPVEISQRIIVKYTDVIEQCAPHPKQRRVRLNPEEFLFLNNNRHSLDMIGERIREWNINLNAKEIYSEMVTTGDACHGVYSAIFLLSMLDDIYQQANPKREYLSVVGQGGRDWNETYFVQDIVSACSAIFLHNLEVRVLGTKSIDVEKAPLAYLLRLCDILQDWDRPNGSSNEIP